MDSEYSVSSSSASWYIYKINVNIFVPFFVGRTQDCLDRNYGTREIFFNLIFCFCSGGVFIIWDRMFGTFQSEDDTQVVYGLVGLLHSFDLLWIQFNCFYQLKEKFFRMEGAENKLYALIKGPSWSPGSCRLGSRKFVPKVRILKTLVHCHLFDHVGYKRS